MRGTSAALLALLAGALALECQAAPAPTQPVYANQRRFRIPFQYDPAELQQLSATEIRLFVSLNRGTDWRYVQSVSPEVRRFDFIADRDGEFWFSVRTIDSKNQVHPRDDVFEAGLKVIVDTSPPRLNLTLQQLEPGKVELGWQALDPNLDPKTLRLEYIQTGAQRWEQVGIIPQSGGQTSWSFPQGGTVAVRGTVVDQAGNSGRAQIQVDVAPAVQAPPKPVAPEIHEPIAARDDREQTSLVVPPTLPDSRLEPTSVRSMNSGTEESTILVRPRGFAPFLSPATAPGKTAGQQAASGSGNEPPQVAASQAASRPITQPEEQSHGRNRFVNSPKFQIGYRVDDVGLSGIGAVELYITEDQGRQWWKYGNDPDGKSPFEVQVPHDGAFGFQIRVCSRAGFATQPPKPGDEPSLTVIVDRTPPLAKLFPVEQGAGPEANKLLIRWQVADDHATDKPVALYYAAGHNGPWVPIVGWQENAERYLWQVGSDMPSRLYIRLETRDAAGNITRVDSPELVLVDRSKPSARIVDVESVNAGGPPR